VNAGSDLKANHIIQSALVIGGTSQNHGLVTIDASDSIGNPLALAAGPAVSLPNGDWGLGAGAGAPSAPDGGISPTGSVAEQSAGVPGNVSGSNGFTAAVPEPASLILMSLGIIACLIHAVRRRQSRA
jgi:hypothetical protein